MPTLVYSPGVRAFISTARSGIVDVTGDIVRGRVTRNTGRQPSSWGLTLSNRGRKYDGVFAPNDRVTIFLKRLYWLQSMSGYINSTPYYNAKPGEVALSGSCTLKFFQHFHWDPKTVASVNLLNGVSGVSLPGDTGVAPGAVERLKAMMTEVCGWDEDRIHIGNIPPKWRDFVAEVVDAVREEIDATRPVGGGSIMGGATGANSIGVVHPDRNTTGNRSIGTFIETEGPGSYFGTRDDASTWGRNPALTSAERAPDGWADPWYLALRIPTQHWGNESNAARGGANRAQGISQEQYLEGRRWWTNRKVLVTNPANGKSFVGRVVDIGPNVSTGKAIDMSAQALHEVLGATTGARLTWSFAADSATPGPAITGGGASVSTPGRLSIPSPIPDGASPSSGDFAWGGYTNGKIPESAMTQIRQSNGAHVYMHPIAAEAYAQMRTAASKAGVKLLVTGAFRSYDRQVSLKREKGALAATPGTSNHGWGMAIDVNLGGSFSSSVYKWLQANGARYGWVNPTWARNASGIEEPWHWEFWGIFGAHSRAATRDASGQTQYQIDIQPNQFDELGNGIAAYVPTVGGAGQPISGGVLGPNVAGAQNEGLFTSSGFINTDQGEDLSAVGPLLHSNDVPILPDIAAIVASAGRDFSSAPNGDFIAWFPDYFNIHNYAAVFDLVPMEIADFKIDWSDDRLKTHFFVSGAIGPGGAGSGFGGNITDPSLARQLSKGVASIEYPGLLKVLLGSDDGKALADSATLLKRFGVRPDRSQEDFVLGADAEYYIAVTRFMENWASQFSSQMPLATFLPEVYPGMVVRSSELNFQCYVESVTHTFDLSSGFETSLGITAPSRLDGKGLFGAALEARRELRGVG